jgi:alanine racemase
MHGSTDAEHGSDTARAWVEVDLGALRRNAATMAARARVPIVPMIKADAYGMGAVRVARALEPLDPFAFGVATIDEARELRDAGVGRRIVVYTPLLPDDLAQARTLGLTPTLGGRDAVEVWRGWGGGAWHLAVDTGMNRAGVRWDEMGALTDVVAACPPEAALTHFHSADEDAGSVADQERRFREAIATLPARPRYLYAENSPALERRTPSPWDLARPGVYLYGVGGEAGADVEPEQVAHVRARVVELRRVLDGETVSYGASWRARGDRRIATLAIGYGDGYRRALSNRGEVLVKGRRATVAGKVTMDMTMIDVTDVACDVGDVVTLLGADGSGDVLRAVDVARVAELSPYELLVGLRLRLPRLYVERARSSGQAGVVAAERGAR